MMKSITLFLLCSAFSAQAFYNDVTLSFMSKNAIQLRGGAEVVKQKSNKTKKSKKSKSSASTKKKNNGPAVHLEANFEIDAASVKVYINHVMKFLQRMVDVLKKLAGNLSNRLVDEVREKASINTQEKQTVTIQKKSKKKRRKTDSSSNIEKSGEKASSTSSKKKKKKKAGIAAAKSSANLKNHLNLSPNNPNYRIQKELKNFITAPPENLTVKVGKNIRVWIIIMKGAKNTIYEGETYRLRVEFPTNYPMNPPSMYFLQPSPQHEHVYTNGDICLSLLGKDWRPTMTAQSVAISILSILSSAQSKELPQDNAAHSLNKPGQAQNDWVYHDDNC